MIVENFDELGQPYTCEQWGAFAEENLPMIFTDGTPAWDFFLWDMFSLDCSAGTIVIDHNMRIRHVLDYFPADYLNTSIIPELLIELEESRFDINGDGLMNILDIVSLANIILYDDPNILGDVNQDDHINILDIVSLVNWILFENDDVCDDIDGNIYETVQIDDQLWMAENLKVTRFNNGDEIFTGYSNAEWSTTWDDAYAVYNNDPENAEIYGNLYNWYAIDDSRGICPENFHIPSDDEWYILLEYLGGTSSGSSENWGITGGKMKDVGTIEGGDGLWYAPNEGATNESGFTSIPTGFRSNDGQYYESGYHSIYWTSSTEYYSNGSFMWYLLHDDSKLYRGMFDWQTGLSVRCIAD